MPHVHHAALGTSHPLFVTLILAGTALWYLRGSMAIRPRIGTDHPAWRAASFLVGLSLVWAALASPLAALDHELLTAHMLQHLLLMTLAPPLIWLAAPVRPPFRGVPRQWALSRIFSWWRWPGPRRFAELVGRPRFAWIAASAALLGWHMPGCFALAMRSAPWHWFESLSFLATGLLFWRPVVQPPEGASRPQPSMILYLFFATLPCDILSGFLVFSDRVVYPMYFGSSPRFGFSPLADQQCAAALMWTCVTLVYLTAGAILTLRLLSPQGFSPARSARSGLPGRDVARELSQGWGAL